MSAFDDAFAALIGNEGDYTTDATDRGNWTSGRPGVGKLNGTKYGISAMSYPDVDIKNLTLDAAKQIYKRDYWNKFGGDLIDAGLAFQVFDGAVNSGVSQSIKWLQQAVKATPDGVMGPATRAAIDSRPAASIIAAYNGYRLKFMASTSIWSTYSRGWANRIADNLIKGAV